MGDEYADTELYTVIGEDGHGETYMDGEKDGDKGYMSHTAILQVK